jgi:hypothetical protein
MTPEVNPAKTLVKSRDRHQSPANYKGRFTWTIDKTCPCKPCFRPTPRQTDLGESFRQRVMHCENRLNGNCSEDIQPVHFIASRRFTCDRCGQKVL